MVPAAPRESTLWAMTERADDRRSFTGTSRRIRGAIDGDAGDLDWTVARISPILVQQARYRMRDRLRHVCDPEDVVEYAWQVALPRLADLVARDGRYTPVLFRFLSRAVLLRVNELLRSEARRPTARGAASTDGGPGLDGVADRAPGVWSEIIRRERDGLVARTLSAMDPQDREVIVLRLVEQQPAAEVAARLGLAANAVNVRLHRALARLREQLPESAFDDVAREAEAERGLD